MVNFLENGLNVFDVGKWRFCPSCGRSRGEAQFSSEDPDTERYDWEDVLCSCCRRPWIACPCTPVDEGQCRSIIITEH